MDVTTLSAENRLGRRTCPARCPRAPLQPARSRPLDRELRRRQHLIQDHRGRSHRPRGPGALGERIGERPCDHHRDRLHRSATRRDRAAAPARRHDGRGDGGVSGALPGRARHAAGVDRDAPARVRARGARRPHAPGHDRGDRGRERRRAARAGVLRFRCCLDPVHQAGLRALEARGRGGRGCAPCEARAAREAWSCDLGRHAGELLRLDTRSGATCRRFRGAAP